MGPAELDDREFGYIDLLCSALFFLLDSCFFSFFLVPSSSILAHIGSSWLLLGSILAHLGSILGHLGSILGHLGSPTPPKKSFPKKDLKNIIAFWSKRQLHSGDVILASGDVLHVGENCCDALLFS